MLKAGLISAGVSGVINIGKQAIISSLSPGGFQLDIGETGAAMAGGFVAGAITGGTGAGASLLGPITSKAVVTTGGSFAGGAGSATTTVIDNLIHGKPIAENLEENVKVGMIAGTISGATTKAPPVAYKTPVPYEPVTAQSIKREVIKELWNGVKDEGITWGTGEILY
jgi:hypothetical protein